MWSVAVGTLNRHWTNPVKHVKILGLAFGDCPNIEKCNWTVHFSKLIQTRDKV